MYLIRFMKACDLKAGACIICNVRHILFFGILQIINNNCQMLTPWLQSSIYHWSIESGKNQFCVNIHYRTAAYLKDTN